MKENHIEGRNAVLEAFRSGKTIDKLYVLDGCQDGPVRSITREARKHDTIVNYVTKERLDQISETGKHQGVIAVSAAYDYARVEDILALAEKKGEPPFILILDGIEDPHNPVSYTHLDVYKRQVLRVARHLWKKKQILLRQRF